MTEQRLTKPLWIAAGWAALAAGVVGIVLPLLPTTPFLLLSAFCFSRGSERLHRWLLEHPRFGPPIDHWRRYRAISRSAKVTVVVFMLVLVGISWLMRAPTWLILTQMIVLTGVSVFVLTRREPPSPEDG